MKLKYFILSLALLNRLAVAAVPTLSLSNTNNSAGVNLIFKVQNAKNIKEVKFSGLDDFQVLGREITINTASDNESHNTFTSKLALLPTKAESAIVYVSANVDGVVATSNKVSLIITRQQLLELKRKQQAQQALNKKYQQQIRKQIDHQFKIQQKFFEDMNAIMRKQQQEILKAQTSLL